MRKGFFLLNGYHLLLARQIGWALILIYNKVYMLDADFSVRETSRDKPSVFPRLPPQFTHAGYGCLLGFVTSSPLIRRIRLSIGFLSVRLRFRYPFLSPTPRGASLGSRFGVRRQLRPLWTFTTDRRHARRTKKPS